ncbi:Serine/threonine-protein kinase PknL [Clostridiales bacterium CHKCI001]|nr:Serine/threonine-protein kinase PknL [Clostridiales bacterium CHKCI001]
MKRNLCIGCMKEKNLDGPCPYCGLDEVQYKPSLHHLNPNTILNETYLVGKVLEEDQFGITYIGWDLKRERKLAIKEYYPNRYVVRKLDDPIIIVKEAEEVIYEDGLHKFIEEAEGLKKFQNLPGIVSINDCFKENQTAYMVMEFIEGITLTQVLKKNDEKLSVDVVMRMMEPIITSLSAIHRAGIIHRNIHPDNILVSGSGVAKLINFASVRSFIMEKERSFSMVLNPGYAPEEQYRSRGEQGAWTDVYLLCATIYRVITGVVPEEALERRYEDQIKLPSAFDIQISKQQERCLMKGLAILKQDRYQTMDELHRGIYEGYWPREKKPNTEQEKVAEGQNYGVIKEHEFHGRRKVFPNKVIPVAAVCILLLAVGTWKINKDKQDVVLRNNSQGSQLGHIESEKTSELERETRAEESTNKTEHIKEEKETNTEKETSKPQKQITENRTLIADSYTDKSKKTTVLGSKIERKEILTITFLDDLKEIPKKAWDVSEDKNEAVMAWTEKNGDGYDLYIAANGKITANQSCKELFAGYENVKEIEFNDCFDTSNTTDMRAMFKGCKELNSLDLSSLDTSKVVGMGEMFYQCEKLKKLDLSEFNTSKVINMAWMFFECMNLTDLDISEFDTSNVTHMEGMFNACKKLESLDVSSFDTSKVTNMEFMFGDCRSLTALDVSGFNTSKVVNMAWMFCNCRKLTNLDINSFDLSNVENKEFMLEFILIQ